MKKNATWCLMLGLNMAKYIYWIPSMKIISHEPAILKS